MSYATLMVYVDVEGEMDGRVSVAADLARRFDAHLIGIASGAPISVVLGEDGCTGSAEAPTRDLIHWCKTVHPSRANQRN